MALTGRFWFRKTWMGRLVLLVEEERPRRFGGGGKLRWRDARLMDFAEPAMRPLMTVEQIHRAGGAPGSVRPLRAVPTPVASTPRAANA
ncbi:hypothetical protein Q8W71_00145 [Methylobacterium sp. NEAU 140]|uniref:hypothetical protein n=1 Tax=Methylobacterium sp. NEAU 140 TaxID=3064945 RepID=UPI002733DD7C|nr:hypothetical protein [Methylobacterium sp. NEAU 140]MDP4021019.1 hypothetical protein [Methylobacterium sp. NEAU 140]